MTFGYGPQKCAGMFKSEIFSIPESQLKYHSKYSLEAFAVTFTLKEKNSKVTAENTCGWADVRNPYRTDILLQDTFSVYIIFKSLLVFSKESLTKNSFKFEKIL